MSKMFITEVKSELSQKHHISLRSLYTPIIGQESVLLYSLLLDQHSMNNGNPAYYKLADISSTMKTTVSSLFVSLKKLEAVGLVRTFEKANETHYIFMLNPPLLPEQFKNNSFLFSQTIKHIDDTRFEKVYFSSRESKIEKEDFQEVTTKFQDVFDLSSKSTENTLEINMAKFANKDEAKKGLNPLQYIKFTTGVKVSPVQMSTIQRIQNLGFSSASINEIIEYSNTVNGKVVSKHIEAIANDMSNKEILTVQEITMELNNAATSKTSAPKKKIETSKVSNDVS